MGIPSNDTAAINVIDGLVDTLTTNLATANAELEVLDRHIHGISRSYGLSASSLNAGQGSTIPLVVTGGNNVFGTELLLCKGLFGGTYFDAGSIGVVACSAANSPTLIEFYSHTVGAQIAYTMANAGDKVTAAGILENDRVIFYTIVEGNAAGVTTGVVYHALAVAAGAFNVALTAGGAVVTVSADLTGFIRKLTPTFMGDKMISAASTTSDTFNTAITMPRVLSTSYLSCKAKSKSGDITGISFFIDVHTYAV